MPGAHTRTTAHRARAEHPPTRDVCSLLDLLATVYGLVWCIPGLTRGTRPVHPDVAMSVDLDELAINDPTLNMHDDAADPALDGPADDVYAPAIDGPLLHHDAVATMAIDGVEPEHFINGSLSPIGMDLLCGDDCNMATGNESANHLNLQADSAPVSADVVELPHVALVVAENSDITATVAATMEPTLVAAPTAAASSAPSSSFPPPPSPTSAITLVASSAPHRNVGFNRQRASIHPNMFFENKAVDVRLDDVPAELVGDCRYLLLNFFHKLKPVSCIVSRGWQCVGYRMRARDDGDIRCSAHASNVCPLGCCVGDVPFCCKCQCRQPYA